MLSGLPISPSVRRVLDEAERFRICAKVSLRQEFVPEINGDRRAENRQHSQYEPVGFVSRLSHQLDSPAGVDTINAG